MQQVGRALALDPDSDEALQTLVDILRTPPTVLPPEVAVEIERAEAANNRKTSAFGVVIYLMAVLAAPLVFVVGVRRLDLMIPFVVLGLLCAAISLYVSRMKRPSQNLTIVVLFLSSAMFASLGVIAGPMVLVPPLLVANTVAYSMQGPRQVLVMTTSAAALIVPALGEWAGWWSASYRFADGTLQILPRASEMTSALPVIVIVVAVVALLMSSLVVSRVRIALRDAQRQLYLYAWHLREFVPEAARAPTDPTRSRRESSSRS
jgi:serine/threonine-protein kinase